MKKLSVPLCSSLDAATGALLTAIGCGALWAGRTLESGTLDSMQSGFFPNLLGIALVVLGGVIAARALVVHGPRLLGWGWRPALFVTLSVVAFAVLLDRAGLVISILAVVGIAEWAGRPLRPMAFAALGGALATASVAVFAWGLGLPLPVWP